MLLIKYSIIFLSVLIIFSCGRAKRKGEEVLVNSKDALSQKKAEVEDRLIRKFDSYSPDTKFNKKRFREFFHFEPTPDVRNIYCYADEMGIDAKYQFSFNCNVSTLNQIIKEEGLLKVNASDDYKFNNILDPEEFSWWQNDDLKSRVPFYRNYDNFAYSYLWYDTAKNKAYYFTYDL